MIIFVIGIKLSKKIINVKFNNCGNFNIYNVIIERI